MLSFGMPTLIETKTLEECAVLCRELGLEFIELNMNLPQYQLHNIDAESLNKIAEKYGVSYTVHLDENLNISDFNPYVADAYLRTVLETIELAKNIHAEKLNMHLSNGVYFTLPDKKVFLFDEYREQYIKSITDFRDKCENAIGDSGIKICVENTSGYADFQFKAIDILLQSSVFGLTFDIGHDHCIGNADEPMILERANRLYHMHMHDAQVKGNHLALGTGAIDLQKYLELANSHDCSVVLETKTVKALHESVGWLRENTIIGD